MTRIASGFNPALMSQIANTRVQMEGLERQIASGKKAQTHGGLGERRATALDLRAEMSKMASWRDNIALAKSHVKIMNSAIEHVREHAVNARSQMRVGGFEPMADGQTLAQKQARVRLADMVDMLNSDIGGRYLFAGKRSDAPPVRPPAELLEGAGGRAGFRQIMNERLQADMGTGGRGRLALGAPDAGSVSLTEDVAGSPFGFKLAAVRTDMAGVSVNGPAGSPASLSVSFGAPLPENGQKITLSLKMPDGSEHELSLTARRDGDLQPGEFRTGPDAAATAASFRTALGSKLAIDASRELAAASMQAAASDFFVSGENSPMRVDGPPFDSATSLRAGTQEDTVSWYEGDKSTGNPREGAIARIGENQLVAYGARADESALANALGQMAILASASFDAANGDAANQYAAMTSSVASSLGENGSMPSLENMMGEMAIIEGSLGKADEQHIATDNMMTGFLADIESTDINEAAAKLLSLQTQLQASYQVTSMLSKLSLSNFL